MKKIASILISLFILTGFTTYGNPLKDFHPKASIKKSIDQEVDALLDQINDSSNPEATYRKIKTDLKKTILAQFAGAQAFYATSGLSILFPPFWPFITPTLSVSGTGVTLVYALNIYKYRVFEREVKHLFTF